ncbi:MAG: PAS domain-containing sensor histidine kinase [Planctomycetota bacterium]|jgi:signal transduction histidine kinase
MRQISRSTIRGGHDAPMPGGSPRALPAGRPVIAAVLLGLLGLLAAWGWGEGTLLLLLTAIPPLGGAPRRDGPDGSAGEAAPADVSHRPLEISALEGLADAAILVDAGTGALRGNSEARVLFDAALGGTLAHWQAHHPLHLDEAGPPCPGRDLPIARALRGEHVDAEMVVPAAPGAADRRWLGIRARPLLGPDGAVIGAVAAYRDISRHKRIEATLAQHRSALERQHQRQSAVAEMELAILKPSELKEVLDHVVRLVERLLPASAAAIVLWDDTAGQFVIPATTAPHRDKQKIRTEGGATRWILDNRRPLTITDADEDPFGAGVLLRAGGFRAYSGVPLVADNRAIGVLYALDAMPRGRSQEELDFMASLANRAATAIARVRLYDELRRLNASLRQNEHELHRHRDQLERLVEQRTSELRTSHERLAAADRLASLGTLTAGLGHDMNNLLFPLRCRLDAIDWSAVPDACRDLLQSTEQTVSYLQQLVDGLRLFALDPEDATASDSVTLLPDWWALVESLLRNAVPDDIAIDARLADDLPPVRVAPHRLTQAVLNLAINAAEAGPLSRRIGIDATHADGWVHLAVRDDGVGMSPDVLRQAFDPFFTTKTRRLSTGLGLSLVHGVIRGSGGQVAVRSTPGTGTTIELVLPAARNGAVADREENRGVALVSLANEHARAWVSRLLDASGYAVRHGDGPGDGPCQLWVTDPSMDRFEVARLFLGGTSQRRIVVIGEADAGWTEIGAIVVREERSLEALRRVVV